MRSDFDANTTTTATLIVDKPLSCEECGEPVDHFIPVGICRKCINALFEEGEWLTTEDKAEKEDKESWEPEA